MNSSDEVEALVSWSEENIDKLQLKKILSNNLDVFAWSPTDMPGVDPSIICYRLSIDPKIKSVK